MKYSTITFLMVIFFAIIAYLSEMMKIFKGISEGSDFAILNAIFMIAFIITTALIMTVEEIQERKTNDKH